MLYYDPTEARDATRVPLQVIRSGLPLPGLETETGADFLLSPLSAPKMEAVRPESRASLTALRKHCEAGLLIQRKSGLDLIGSLPALAAIQLRMAKYSRAPWLLIIGTLGA